MKKLPVLFLMVLLVFAFDVKGQDTLAVQPKYDVLSIGLGAGLDYGCFGGSLLLYPQENVGLFAGAGYAMAGIGVNGGIKFRATSKNSFSTVNPYFLAMYGYNAVITVANATQFNKFFYGPTVGIGIDMRSNASSRGYWSVALLIPLRSAEVKDYMDDLKNNHGVEFKNDLWPIGFSFGYRFILD
jgi:hypothetical protein